MLSKMVVLWIAGIAVLAGWMLWRGIRNLPPDNGDC
jgi:hypothetical protein